MNKSGLKRKRVDVSCPAPEDASSFYKRLGLDILAPSSTSGQTEEARPPKKRPVQQASHTAPLTTTPNQRPDKVGHQWNQSQQRERQAPYYFRQNYPHENRFNERTVSVNTAATYRPQYAPVHRPHEQQTHYRTGVVPSSNKYQPQHAQPTRPHGYQTQTKPNYVNGNSIPQQHRVHPTHPHTRTESMSTVASLKPQHAQQPRQRVVRKEPQVKPINRYAPPDYMTLMYHPTPTLEDLGLTSYLDSPPSSPRTRSPTREEKTADSQPERESARRILPAWDAPKSSEPEHESMSISADSKLHVANSVARETKQTASLARQQLPVMSEAKERKHKRHPTPAEINQHLSKKLKPQGYVLSFAPKGWVPPADKYSEGHTPKVKHGSEEGVQRSLSNLSTDAPKCMMTSQTEDTWTKTSCSAVSSSLPARSKKAACDWSMIAEQYSTESRQSDDMEAKRDANYKRYINEGRLFGGKEKTDAGHHQNQTQDAWRHPNSSHTQSLSKQTFNQTNAAGIINDLFGGMSPYSCWIQSTPEDRRCSLNPVLAVISVTVL